MSGVSWRSSCNSDECLYCCVLLLLLLHEEIGGYSNDVVGLLPSTDVVVVVVGHESLVVNAPFPGYCKSCLRFRPLLSIGDGILQPLLIMLLDGSAPVSSSALIECSVISFQQ